MDGAEKLRRDTIPFVPRAQSVGAEPPLQISMNPFVAGMSGSRMGRPLQMAFGEVIRQIGEQTPVVVVVGSAGTGKSMLVEMTARACVGMGLSVRRIERGDLVQTAFGEKSDVLLVDQTDSISSSNLQTLLLASGKNIATTMVFLCLPSSVSRFSFSGTQAAVVELTPLSLSDARNYLQERATSIGRPNLFAPEALDAVIDGSRGLPRMLRSIAQLAFFAAASEGASQINPNHVSNALASQVTLDNQSADAEIQENARHLAPQVSVVPAVVPAADTSAPRVALENHDADVLDVLKARKIDVELRTNPPRAVEPLIPRATQETQNQNSIADIAAHVRFATQKRDVASTPQVSANAITETPSVRVVPTVPVAASLTPAVPVVAPPAPVAPIAAASVAAELPSNPLPSLRASVQPPKSMAAARVEAVPAREGQGISRWVGIAGGLAACFAVAAVVSFNLMSNGPDSAKRAPAALAIAKPADISKAIVQAPVPDTQAVSAALPAPITDRVQARDNAIASLIAKGPALSVPAGSAANAVTPPVKPNVVARTPATPPAVTNQPARATRATEEGAARKLAEERARAEREAADRAKSAADAAAQLAAAQAAGERAAGDRVAAERAAQEKAGEEKAIADRTKAAELAAIQAQETTKLALEQEAARRAKAAKDAADKAAKDAADEERAEKMAAEAAKAARQESNRVFSHSLFGFSR